VKQLKRQVPPEPKGFKKPVQPALQRKRIESQRPGGGGGVGGVETNTSSNCSLAKTETWKRKKSGKPDFTATLSDNERFVVVVVVVSLSLFLSLERPADW
jgi:hypothetical protein